jgi:uncharacterized protein YdeI (YjbR/CyaY-like superfamily)
MKTDVQELIFTARKDFRGWLQEHAATSDGVWLLFGKTKAVVTLTANEALEEALCFGWVDGQMKSIDNTKYRKYFARRREKSPWSDKNKKIVEGLRERGLMAAAGEEAVEVAKRSGMWDASPSGAISDEQIASFEEQLSGFSPAQENFAGMPRSSKVAYVRRHLSFKKEDTRRRDFETIVELLKQNRRPGI